MAARLSGWGGFSGFQQRQGGSGVCALGSRCLTSQAFWPSLHKDALLCPVRGLGKALTVSGG